jgi:curli biogenesis system outer membrane secretion channel CsgG
MSRFPSLSPIALAMLLLAGSASAQAPASASPDLRPTVAVMPFNNGAIGKAHEELDPLRIGVADLLISELSDNRNIRVIERDQLKQLLDEQSLSGSARVDKETAVKVGKLLGVHHMIFGVFVTDPKGAMRLDARAVDVETGRIEHVERVSDRSDNFMAMIVKLGEKLNTGMKLPEMPKGVREARLERQEKVPFQVAMLYSRGLAEKDAGNNGKAVELFKAALAKFPLEPAQRELDKLQTKPGA